jgi:elongation factor 2
MYLCTVTVPQQAAAGVYSTLRLRRATIKSGEEVAVKGTTCTIEAFLPVAESFGFTELLRKNTSGQGFPQLSFSHWQLVKGDLNDPNSYGYKVMMDIRKRKGLKLELPTFSDYHESV